MPMTSKPENIKNLSISEFMTRDVITITENESVGEACKLMYKKDIGSLIIIKKDIVIPVGIVTERDITKMVGFSEKFFADMPVVAVMSQPLITINPLTSVGDAVFLMEQKNIRRLPVINPEGLIVGIITSKDIFKPLMKIFKQVAKEKDLVSDGFDLLGLIGME
jgi:CBS domain-containing protein